MLASGYLDAVVEARLEPYDFLSMVPIVEAAGGAITDWDGKSLRMESGGRVVAAATSELHREILSFTAGLQRMREHERPGREARIMKVTIRRAGDPVRKMLAHMLARAFVSDPLAAVLQTR
jgi:hypothetical protein